MEDLYYKNGKQKKRYMLCESKEKNSRTQKIVWQKDNSMCWSNVPILFFGLQEVRSSYGRKREI